MTYHATRSGFIITALGWRLHLVLARVAKPAPVPPQAQPQPTVTPPVKRFDNEAALRNYQDNKEPFKT